MNQKRACDRACGAVSIKLKMVSGAAEKNRECEEEEEDKGMSLG